MPYGAMPSRLMPIDADGTVVGQSQAAGPVSSYPLSADVVGWVTATAGGLPAGQNLANLYTFCFFPETRTVLGLTGSHYSSGGYGLSGLLGLAGSADTTNGSDGTWEAASFPGGLPAALGTSVTTWRTAVAALTFSAAKSVVRTWAPVQAFQLSSLHIYGVKATGQTPDDILFLDGDTAFAEYALDKDFGDRPLGTTVVKQFKLKNSSATKTANLIVVACNDADFAISNDGVTYGTGFTIASLGSGVSSAVLYIRNTTPAPGAALGPRQVRLSAAVGSYT